MNKYIFKRPKSRILFSKMHFFPNAGPTKSVQRIKKTEVSKLTSYDPGIMA